MLISTEAKLNTIPDSSSAEVDLFIDEGPATYLRKININYPDSSDKSEIDRII